MFIFLRRTLLSAAGCTRRLSCSRPSTVLSFIGFGTTHLHRPALLDANILTAPGIGAGLARVTSLLRFGEGLGVSKRHGVGAEGDRGSRIQTQARQDALDFRKLPDGDITVGAGDGQLTAVRAPSQPPNRPVVIGQ